MRRFEHGGNTYAHPGCVDFSASLNPMGMPEAARRALREGVDAYEAYPDPASAELVAAIARLEGVPREWVVPCAGATDAFARICQVVRPRVALVCAPCYAGYEQALAQAGATVRHHRLSERDGFAVGEGLADDMGEDCDLVFLANPNNPTGVCVGRDVLRAALLRAEHVGALVVVDECFVDLTSRRGSNDLVAGHPNMVLVKAFTKSFCLAGLRLGYAIVGEKGLAGRLWDAGQPWAVSAPAQVAGAACLADAGYLQRSRDMVARERGRLARALRALGLHVVPGEANYLLFRAPRNLSAELLRQGVLVRSCENFVGLDGRWHRVAVRTAEQNDLLADALRRVLADLGSDPGADLGPCATEAHAGSREGRGA